MYVQSQTAQASLPWTVAQNTMNRKLFTSSVLIVALACAAAVFYWVHQRGAETAIVTPLTTAPGAQPATASGATTGGAPGTVSAGASSETSAGTAGAAAPDASYFLRTGETLEYTANVAKVSNVAALQLSVVGRPNFLGKDAWHLQATAHTQNPLRMVMQLDDQFDSYSAAGSFVSMQYEMRLNERGERVDSQQRLTTTASEPAPAHITEARVLPGTRDPLSMMQFLRATDWSRTPEVRSPVYDGHKLYEARARLAGTARVTVPAGRFTTSKIAIQVFDGGAEMKDAQFTLYIADDPARTPVLLEAVLPMTAAQVELVKRTSRP